MAPSHWYWGFLKGGVAVGTPITVRDVGGDSTHGKVPGGVSAQILQEYYGETSKATYGWDLGVPTSRDSDGGDRV